MKGYYPTNHYDVFSNRRDDILKIKVQESKMCGLGLQGWENCPLCVEPHSNDRDGRLTSPSANRMIVALDSFPRDDRRRVRITDAFRIPLW